MNRTRSEVCERGGCGLPDLVFEYTIGERTSGVLASEPGHVVHLLLKVW